MKASLKSKEGCERGMRSRVKERDVLSARKN